jgi:hypothetical protein
MKRPWLFVAGLILFSAAGGCAKTAGPNWLHPGGATVQQTRALRYDPYPENGPGPPVVGGRPREYQIAPPETSRSRWHLGGWGQ